MGEGERLLAEDTRKRSLELIYIGSGDVEVSHKTQSRRIEGHDTHAQRFQLRGKPSRVYVVPINLDDDQVRFYAIGGTAQTVKAVQAPSQFPGEIVILRQAAKALLESHKSRGGDYPRLAHPTTEAFTHTQGGLDELLVTGNNRPHRGAQSLGQAEGHGVCTGRKIGSGDTAGGRSVTESRSVHMKR